MKLKTTLISAAMLFAGVMSASAAEAKYIFYYIGDGMGMGPVLAAETYNRMELQNEQPLLMMQLPVVGWCMTYSASKPITDSSAAGTALSTGYKTKNYMLGMAPDTTAVTSIAKMFKDEGYGVGVVTSVAPDDATPGAFYAHVPNRSMYYDIDCQMAENDYDFMAGAGLRGLKDKQGNATDVLERFAKNNVQIVRGPAEIADIKSEKVLLLNSEGTSANNIGYTVDSISGILTLPQIASTCLAHLEKTSPDKFFMMVEGGNIDHALHANDGGAAIIEILNFNEALEVAFDFYRQHPDETLIVVTADHDTGGLALSHPNPVIPDQLKYVKYQKISKEEFSAYCKGLLKSRMNYTWDDMKDYLTENLGLFTHVPVSAQDEENLKQLFDRTFELRNTEDQKTLYANFNAFAVDVFRVFNDACGLKYTTTSHSGNPVPVFAVGVGSDLFKGFNNNSNLPGLIRKAAGK